MERKTRRQQKEAQAKEILEDFVSRYSPASDVQRTFVDGIYTTSTNLLQSDTPKASSNAPTPGMSNENWLAGQQFYHQPGVNEAPPPGLTVDRASGGLIEAPRPRTTFEFETAEVEEADLDMVDR